jgi:hypothetical protein
MLCRVLSRRRRIAAIVTVNLLAAVVLAGLAEVGLRHRGLVPWARSYPGATGGARQRATWVRTDPVLGWVAASRPPEFNAQGFRDPKDFDRVDRGSARVRVMVLGDSFMVGAGLPREQSVPVLLEQRLGEAAEVYNVAVSGWGIDQMYLAFRRYHDRIGPQVVLLAYIDDDVRRVLDAFRDYEAVAKPVLAHDGDRIGLRTRAASGTEAIASALMARSVVVSQVMERVYLARDARPVVAGILRQMAEVTRARGEALVVVRVPTQGSEKPVGRLTRGLYSFERFLTPYGALWLDPRDQMARTSPWPDRFYLHEGPGVGHLSAEGAAWLAGYLHDRWIEAGLPGATRARQLEAEH